MGIFSFKESMKYSIDISRYQGAINLDVLANCGVEIETIIVKSSSGLNKDPAFDAHATKVKNDGRFKLGIYH
jgi:GH25 family lysozyme M1 (1,4-beta-N-acetylmuramidase)